MKEILSSATTWMELERILLSEIRQMKKDKYHIIYLTWNIRKKKKTKTNSQIQRTDCWLPEGKGLKEGEMKEGDQVYGDGWLLDLLITLYCTPILICNIVYLKFV